MKYKKKISSNPPRFRTLKNNSTFRFPHVVIEDKKEVWVYIASGFPSTLAVSPLMKIHYPGYKGCLCNKETFIKIGGKI